MFEKVKFPFDSQKRGVFIVAVISKYYYASSITAP
jgi:hypothetical protein